MSLEGKTVYEKRMLPIIKYSDIQIYLKFLLDAVNYATVSSAPLILIYQVQANSVSLFGCSPAADKKASTNIAVVYSDACAQYERLLKRQGSI